MKRAVIILLSLVMVAVIGVASGIMYVSGKVTADLTLESETLFTIESGSNAYRTVKHLREAEITDVPPFVAKVWLKFFAGSTSVKSGTYMLRPDQSLVDVFTLFTQGDEHFFTVSLVEGLTLSQWIETLKQNTHLVFDLNDDKLGELTQGNGVDWCCEDVSQTEGVYLADTYFFTKGTTASEVLKRAHRALIAFVSHEWEQRDMDLPLATPYEALILASIIEKETAVPEERDMISGVFVNRLNKNMRLQTDPTVIYGIGPTFDGNITRKHLRTATPYNTYVIKGLPPTPIAMAGKAAIHAALHPLSTDALYFVAKGDGSHQFSTTLAEHNAAVRKYQLKR
ncbi:endolytic transglycosylase MltG [Alteromonas sp. BL110]|uniref:endolytic transglycosylase MltG n=1 Tax=Alteromonas sp. BL110 TaxID=1714845 RepID=UPI000E483E84|nr:endolytic transglycosylase MltG [Alteromonas sp. BL110]AXT40626.1 endolytic transglycosylase MltG [Alteromonas sp. BL110]RKM79862.1 endolytic transglycosylase MltG [Alteromonas sp. BL110]